MLIPKHKTNDNNSDDLQLLNANDFLWCTHHKNWKGCNCETSIYARIIMTMILRSGTMIGSERNDNNDNTNDPDDDANADGLATAILLLGTVQLW